MRTLIIGAGMAGLACAERLSKAGYQVTLLDKGRGAGGRMATRRLSTDLGEATFDHGAQSFTPSDPRFEARVRRWMDEGRVAPWPAAGEGALVGVPAMNAPLKAMAEDLDVRWATRVVQLSRSPAGWDVVTEEAVVFQCDTLVIALPAEQAGQLLEGVVPEWSAQAIARPSSPCWTVMLVLSEPLPTAPDGLRGDDDAILFWAARNSTKPGRTGPESWVLQAAARWSEENVEAPKAQVEADLLVAFSERLAISLPTVMAASSHRWRFARPAADGSGPLWDPGLALGLCGDWLAAPTVEGAWLSGVQLGDVILLGGSR
jgi:predicted NAD/FAD-dependent oxidoreductase